jgi:hypothetical protein
LISKTDANIAAIIFLLIYSDFGQPASGRPVSSA